MAPSLLVQAAYVQQRLGVGATTLWRWRKSGAGPRWAKLGARVMYDHDDVERFMEERIAASSGPDADRQAALQAAA